MEEEFSGTFDSETLLRAIGDAKNVKLIVSINTDSFVIKLSVRHDKQVTDFLLDAE